MRQKRDEGDKETKLKQEGKFDIDDENDDEDGVALDWMIPNNL